GDDSARVRVNLTLWISGDKWISRDLATKLYLAYSNFGAAISLSLVAPGRTILPICCLNSDTGTATSRSPTPRNPPTPTITYESERLGVTVRSLISPILSPASL